MVAPIVVRHTRVTVDHRGRLFQPFGRDTGRYQTGFVAKLAGIKDRADLSHHADLAQVGQSAHYISLGGANLLRQRLPRPRHHGKLELHRVDQLFVDRIQLIVYTLGQLALLCQRRFLRADQHCVALDFDVIRRNRTAGRLAQRRAGLQIELRIVPGTGHLSTRLTRTNRAIDQWAARMGAAIAEGVKGTVHVVQRDLLAIHDHELGAAWRYLGNVGHLGPAIHRLALGRLYHRHGRADLLGHRLGFDVLPAIQRVEHAADRGGNAGDQRRVAQGVVAGLGFAQLLYQIKETGGRIRLKRHHEFLVVQAVGIGRVELDVGILAANPDMLVHHALAICGRQGVPGARLDEGIHEQILALAGYDDIAALGLFLGRVLVDIHRPLGHGQKRVRQREVRPHGRGHQLGMQLLKIFQPLAHQP